MGQTKHQQYPSPTQTATTNLQAGIDAFKKFNDLELSRIFDTSLPSPFDLVMSPSGKDPRRFWAIAAMRLATLLTGREEVVWKAESETSGTTKTRYVGLGLVNTQPGDVVCMLKGAETLFVLRPRGDGTWVLVGEAYVQGVIDREAFEDGVSVREWRDIVEEEFILA